MEDFQLYQETELLTRLTGGDETAYRAVFERYHAALYLNAIRLVRTEEEARDVVQEVFITLWEKRTTIDTGRSIGGWLFTLCYNRAVNHLKMKLRRELREREADAAISHSDPDDSNLFEEQHALLEAALNTLSPQKRKVFELCKLQGKTYEAAAQEMNISRYTVNEYLKQAMTSIREYIRDQPPHTTVIAALALEIFFQ